MWNAITVAIVAFFSAFTQFASAFGKIAGAADNLAGVAESTTKVFADEAAFKQKKQLAQLEDDMAKYQQSLTNNPSTTAP